MLDRHPVAVWTSILVTLVTLAAGVGGGWYFILDERERSIEQSDRLAEIRREQEGIRKELATQTLLLREVRSEQDQIEARQRWLASEVNRAVGDMAVDVGRLMERTKDQ